MPTIDPTPPLAPAAAGTADAKKAPDAMGKEAFLKLLVGQLKGQNPLDPMKDQDFMGQMAQFSMLEQLTNIAADSKQGNHAAAVDQAIGLIGKKVSYEKADKSQAAGTVEKVSIGKDGAVKLTISGVTGIDPATVREVG